MIGRRTLKVLEECSQARANDNILYIEMVKHYSKHYKNASNEAKQVFVNIVLEMKEQATYKRERAFIQNELNLCLAPLGVKNNRKLAQEEYQQKIREAKKDKLGLFQGLARFFKKF